MQFSLPDKQTSQNYKHQLYQIKNTLSENLGDDYVNYSQFQTVHFKLL